MYASHQSATDRIVPGATDRSDRRTIFVNFSFFNFFFFFFFFFFLLNLP